MFLRAVLPLVVVTLLAAGVVALGATGRMSFVPDPVPGRPLALVEGVPGPDTGPVCPLDARFVDEPPTGLPPDVLDAWQRLTDAAGRQGVRLCLNDGKRSTGQQQHEFDDAVRRFGSVELAAQYVLPPEKSMHVRGRAVDVQPHDSALWLERNAGPLGWCRRYDNEYWHFEHDPSYATAGCPALLPSATGT
ncbi:D-alanyl-D-alanine carboxypeptidase family protein [Saccharothrix obliqua]|uniref:D-alanyl-D-alanine carboxypeptidase family protein n=1 Tax=Saccharothrix obliqua TaxID=2861747 RepID=UPI001C6021F9|nr:D-alanyl-D-alanine carboxypeptidase family protein [Saccharothrix obliqua]MBW4718147.1 D-alanyl-D-alanine carboxypeptidase family protein [Saccharothrix obliqua]